MDNITNNIISNLVDMGVIDMNSYSKYVIPGNEYSIRFSKSNYTFQLQDGYTRTQCRMEFYNIMNTHILTIVSSEEEISLFINYVYDFIEFYQNEFIYTFKYNNYGNMYGINIARSNIDSNEPDTITVSILQYQHSEAGVIVRIKFDLILETLLDLLDCIYYTFLYKTDYDPINFV